MDEQDEHEERIFEIAVELPPSQRTAYLDHACANDPELRERVEELLGALERSDGFLQEPVVAPSGKPFSSLHEATERVGHKVDRYKLLQFLGEGGCGVVYLAEQEVPVRRRVALKIIKPGMDTKSVVARFEAERQALAIMDHPNIAKFLDAGVTTAGRPYFVMELVRGRKVTEFCDQNELDTRSRLDLFIQVCRAVQHAHQKGILHRDLKPSNILVTLHDGLPVPKIIDFGIAKAMQGRLTDKTVYTAFEQFIGTPAYMSPEQAEMSGLDVDTRSDIYSLGVLLYELLTGRTPFDGKELMSMGLDAMRRTIREKEPARPSTRLTMELSRLGSARGPCAESDVAPDSRSTPSRPREASQSEEGSGEAPQPARGTSALPEQLRTLINALRGDLDWIVMKCLEKDRTRRYESADGLAMDVHRHLVNEPIVARPPGAIYKFQKAWRRNKVTLSAAMLVIAALIGGIGVSTWQAGVAQRKTADLREQNYVADIGLAYQAIREGNLEEVNSRLEKYDSHVPEADLRGFEWRFLASQAKGNYVRDLGAYQTSSGGFLSGVAISPDGRFVALNRANPARVEVQQFNTGAGKQEIAVPAAVLPVVYSSSGRWLAGITHDESGDHLVGWDTENWKPRKPVRMNFPFTYGHQTNAEIFVGRVDDHLELWSATTWEKIGELTNATGHKPLMDPSFARELHMVNALTISFDDRVAYLAEATEIRRWDLLHRTELSSIPIGGTTCLAASRSGQLAAAARSGAVLLINPQTDQIVSRLKPHIGWITGMKFTADGTRLFSAGADRKVMIYDFARQQFVEPLLGQKSEIWALDVSADGCCVVSGSAYGGRVLTWSLRESANPAVDLSGVNKCAMLGDGRMLIQWNPARPMEFVDPENGSTQAAPFDRLVEMLMESDVRTFVVSPDARWALFCPTNSMVVWNLSTDHAERPLQHRSGIPDAAVFSPDSRFVLTTGADTGVRLWSVGDWQFRDLYAQPGIRTMGFAGDSRRVAIAGTVNGHGIIRAFAIGPVLRELTVKQNEASAWFMSVALSSSGRWLAAGTSDDVIRIWDLTTGNQIRTLREHTQGVMSLNFSPDDRTLASSALSRLILWHTRTWQKLMSIDAEVLGLHFSPDGQYLAALRRPIRSGRSPFIWNGLSGVYLWQAPTNTGFH